MAIGTPLLADGMLYVRIWDGEARIYSSVHALDAATGSLQWQYESGREVFPPVASSGSVYVPGWDNVVALDPETGRPQWVVLVDGFCGRATATEGILYGTGRLNDSYAQSSPSGPTRLNHAQRDFPQSMTVTLRNSAVCPPPHPATAPLRARRPRRYPPPMQAQAIDVPMTLHPLATANRRVAPSTRAHDHVLSSRGETGFVPTRRSVLGLDM